MLQTMHQRTSNRLEQTVTFRGGVFEKWSTATLFVAGAGQVGQRFVEEAVVSGVGRVNVYDPDITEAINLATQRGTPGIAKVNSLIQRCNAIRAGCVHGVRSDILHAGIGELSGADVLVDCTDNPALEMPLTMISTGLRIPKLRLAVDGSGESEMGRVNCSHGGANHACGLCTYSLTDLTGSTLRTPCPGQERSATPTLAGGAIASATAGLGLLQAQRLVTGNDVDQVVNREVVLNFTNWLLLPIERRRSEACLSGHRPWPRSRLNLSADEGTFKDLFEVGRKLLEVRDISLEPYAHPLCTSAWCDCGQSKNAVGARWATPPSCPSCQAPMRWLTETALHRLTRHEATELGISQVPLAELGLPSRGAMIVARATGKPPLRLILD